MKVGDLVKVKPALSGVYLVVGEDPDRENNWPDSMGESSLGKLYYLYDPIEERVADMHEKWLEAVNESR
jgi:hypothetical protein|tara:strand:+ start:67 stop:273 length:207 start_codon:yes stop_codon:yes gene_type:complete